MGGFVPGFCFLLWGFELSFNVCVCENLFSFLLGCLTIPCLHWVFFINFLLKNKDILNVIL